MKPQLLIAIYGAVVATAVAIWNAYTWRRGNRLHLTGSTSADMVMDLHTAIRTGADPGAKYVVLTIGNRGQVPCAVNTVWILAYAGWWSYLRQKHTNSIYVMRPASEHFGCSVPYRLERAGEFRAIALQTPALEELTRTSRVYMAISHSMSSKPFRVRVQPIAAQAPVPLKAKSKAA
jgi:hypothetical protein